MNRKLFQTGTWLLWLALPVTALRYGMVWDQLPSRMATHFNAASQPNGWMSRESSFTFALALTALLLTVFTVVLVLMRVKNTYPAVAWAFLGFSYLLIGTVYYASESIIEYNLSGHPISVGLFLILGPAAAIIFTAAYLGTMRGARLPQKSWLADEVHSSKLWASVFLVPLLIELSVMKAVPMAGVRLGLGLVAILFVGFALQAWTGFHYRFGAYGVEISTLGFRLRSIPRNQIREYAETNWSPMRGYGIRGMGHDRAYVWGNHGVLIKTSNGEVFLGHNQPERIIRDLDAMKQYVQS